MSHQAEPGGNGLGTDGAAAEMTEPAGSESGEAAGEVTELAGLETGAPAGEVPEPAVAESGDPATEMTEPAGGVPEPARPKTGEPRVDAAVTLLDGLAELPVTEHAAVFERVHAELTAVLGQLDPESADGG